MSNGAKQPYRLYALPLTAENIDLAAQERFSRATTKPEPGYVLIYTRGNAPERAQEIYGDRARLLSQADLRWIFDSNSVIAAEELKDIDPEAIKQLSDSVEALEAALRSEKAEIEAKGE